MHGSGEEAVAIRVFDKRRNQRFAETLIMALSNQGSKQVSDLIKEYRGELFVEHAYDSQKFLLNSKKTFEKIAKKFGALKLSLADDPGPKKQRYKGQVEFVKPPDRRTRRHAR